MDLPIDLLCGPIAAYLDRLSINNILSTSKQVNRQLRRSLPCFPWPTRARFFIPTFARKIVFSKSGEWLACGDARGQITLWNQNKGGPIKVWNSSFQWVNELCASSSFLAYGNRDSEHVELYHFETEKTTTISLSTGILRRLLFIDEVLYCLCGKEMTTWTLCCPTSDDGEDGDSEDDDDESIIRCIPTQLFQSEVSISDIVSLSPELLAIKTIDHRAYLWDLKHDIQQEIPVEKDMYVLAIAAVPRRPDLVAISTKPHGVARRNVSLEFWSLKQQDLVHFTRNRKISLEEHSHLTSMILLDEQIWITVDTSWDQILVWYKDRCVRSLVGNPTRLECASHSWWLSWIGRGSTVWVQDIRNFCDNGCTE